MLSSNLIHDINKFFNTISRQYQCTWDLLYIHTYTHLWQFNFQFRKQRTETENYKTKSLDKWDNSPKACTWHVVESSLFNQVFCRSKIHSFAELSSYAVQIGTIFLQKKFIAVAEFKNNIRKKKIQKQEKKRCISHCYKMYLAPCEESHLIL